jgi:hypothetical protein
VDRARSPRAKFGFRSSVLRRPDVAMISDAERPDAAQAAQHPDLNEFVAELSLAEIWRRISEPGALAPLVAAAKRSTSSRRRFRARCRSRPRATRRRPIPALYAIRAAASCW